MLSLQQLPLKYGTVFTAWTQYLLINQEITCLHLFSLRQLRLKVDRRLCIQIGLKVQRTSVCVFMCVCVCDVFNKCEMLLLDGQIEVER